MTTNQIQTGSSHLWAGPPCVRYSD